MIHMAEVVKGELSGMPLAITLAMGTFAIFAVLLFAITRLNPDR